jgi:hypothetical protein
MFTFNCSTINFPNASAHLLPEARARHERKLEAVRCSASLGAGSGRDAAQEFFAPRIGPVETDSDPNGIKIVVTSCLRVA